MNVSLLPVSFPSSFSLGSSSHTLGSTRTQYHIGGVIADRSSLLVTKPETLSGRFRLDMRVNTIVASINRADKTVETRDAVTGATATEVTHPPSKHRRAQPATCFSSVEVVC